MVMRRYTGRAVPGHSLSEQWAQLNGGERSARPLLAGQQEQIEEVDEAIEDGLDNGARYGATEANLGSSLRIQPSALQPEHDR